MVESSATNPRVDFYYEDIVVGEELETPAHTITQADILKFAEVTLDDHPLHTDEEFCRDTPFGRPIAHGLLGVALIDGLKGKLKLYEHTSVASLGWDKVRFKAPIFPGDTLRVKVRFTDKRESRKPDRGVVTEAVYLVNQNDQIVTEGEHTTLLLRKTQVPTSA